MAGTDGTTDDPLIAALVSAPRRYEFHQAVRLLESRAPGKPRVGTARLRAGDAVAFAQPADMAFISSPVAGVDVSGARPRLDVRFLGVFGPDGPMPLHFTEYVQRRSMSHRDRTWQDFCDLFHDRMLAMYHRAWSQANQAASRDRPDADRFGDYVASIAGVGLPSQAGRRGGDGWSGGLEDDAWRAMAGRVADQRGSADGLEDLLSEDLGVPVTVEEFVPRLTSMPDDAVCRLGSDPATATLGETSMVGRRVPQVARSFRLHIGPLGLDDLVRLVPDGEHADRLEAWVHAAVGLGWEWDARVRLLRDAIPETRLGAAGTAGRLGRTTWLGSLPAPGPGEPDWIDDVILRPRRRTRSKTTPRRGATAPAGGITRGDASPPHIEVLAPSGSVQPTAEGMGGMNHG